MVVRSSAVCADSSSATINVYPNAKADFTVHSVCINMPMLPVNNTVQPGTSPVNYFWTLANGISYTLKDPPAQVYPIAGNYSISLAVNTDQCPTPLSFLKKFFVVEQPRPGLNYPPEIAVVNLPLPLEARTFGNQVLWSPATSLDDATSYTPVFRGAAQQLYTIEIKTINGCVTVDSQLVKINKDIVILVPNSFTPNNDTHNDHLAPYMIGIKQLNFFRVYNRWGQLVFETNNAKNGWDGRFKGLALEMQTVVWMLEAIGADNKMYKAKGSTILLR
jgi:gliding motility-associated-like protein